MTGQRKRILIVEDTASVALYLQAKLYSEGFVVDVTADANAALKAWEKASENEGYSLIVTDMQLPECNGADLIVQFNRLSKYPPVFMISADGSQENQARAFSAGADQFFEKPLDMQGFLKAVQATVNDIPEPQRANDIFRQEKLKLEISYKRYLQELIIELNNPMPFSRLSSLLHQIKGSATLYGMTELALNATEGNCRLKKEGGEAVAAVKNALLHALHAETNG